MNTEDKIKTNNQAQEYLKKEITKAEALLDSLNEDLETLQAEEEELLEDFNREEKRIGKGVLYA